MRGWRWAVVYVLAMAGILVAVYGALMLAFYSQGRILMEMLP
jgi:hypothetical protein